MSDNLAQNFFSSVSLQNNPITKLLHFLEKDKNCRIAENYSQMRFVGYVLKVSYNEIIIITSDPYKIAVGGIPRNSFLIMVPDEFNEHIGPYFSLIRVLDTAPTPLDDHVQHTFFELQKKSMPELDIFTQSELQWGALKTEILGMFYPDPDSTSKIEFAGDLNNYVSPHKYRVFKPDDELLDLITNSFVPSSNRFPIGKLRFTENRLLPINQPNGQIGVFFSPKDFMGSRTALFGKTRLGKSNIIKILVESLIQTQEVNNAGQLIFDINGEYSNDNPQDDNRSIASAYEENCEVYAITPKPNRESRPLKLNFYEYPDRSIRVLGNLLTSAGRANSNYIQSFLNVDIPTFESIFSGPNNERLRSRRRLLMYWAILYNAGYSIDLRNQIAIIQTRYGQSFSINPQYNKKLREAMYGNSNPPTINSFEKLVDEFKKLRDLMKQDPGNSRLKSSGSGRALVEADEKALLGFLFPTSGSGPSILQPYRQYHDSRAQNFLETIVEQLEDKKTVILDLGNANPEIMEYFSLELTRAIFAHQVEKFSGNALGDHYIQMYFEEAHNLFPENERSDHPDIYRRVAKEGAKYHIGMIYATQSPSSIHHDLLAQTENFIIAHMSSKLEVDKLSRLNVSFENIGRDILNTKTPGYVRILTRSHRFVIPVQARKFAI